MEYLCKPKQALFLWEKKKEDKPQKSLSSLNVAKNHLKQCTQKRLWLPTINKGDNPSEEINLYIFSKGSRTRIVGLITSSFLLN